MLVDLAGGSCWWIVLLPEGLVRYIGYAESLMQWPGSRGSTTVFGLVFNLSGLDKLYQVVWLELSVPSPLTQGYTKSHAFQRFLKEYLMWHR